MSAPTSAKLTRRGFLRYSGLSVGGMVAAGALGPVAEAFAPVALAPDPELSPRRRATLVALIGALGSVAASIDPARADQVVPRIATQYRIASPDGRRTIDAALDAVELGLEPGEFSRRPVQDRVEVLRAGITGRGHRARGIPSHTSSMQSALTETAVALAAMPFFDGETPWRRELLLYPV